MTAAVDAPGGVFADPRPCPGLTVALQGDPSGLVGQEVEAGLVAAFHADNHAAWARCRWLWEACRSRADTTARVEGDTKAALIAAAALAWSPAMAAARLEFAHQILVRLPALGDGMRAGWLEERRAAILVNMFRELDDAQARAALERVLGRAAQVTHGELAEQAERAAAAVDPTWYEARRAAAIARARVIARSAPSGAAELSGVDLPEDDALEAYNHVVALADAVRAAVRARGGEVTRGFTEAYVYLGLLKPALLGADDATVVATLTEELLHRSDPEGQGPDDQGPDDQGPDDQGPDNGAPEGEGPDDGTDDGGPDDHGSDDHGSDDEGPGDGPAAPSSAGEAQGESAPLAYRAGVAVRLQLTTLLRLDQCPGQVPGYGVVAASTARHLARTRCGAPSRLLLYDPHGRLEYVLTLPPLGPRGARRRGRHRRQVVELTAHTATLDALDPTAPLGLDAALLTRAKTELAAHRARPPGQHPATTTAEAHRRHPGAELAAWIQARDQTCRFPGCTRPAMRADLDHTVDWLFGGPTQAANLGPLCEPHHLLKHDPDHDWALTQSEPAVFEWTSPTGTRHRVQPEVYEQLPDPRPPADGPASIPDTVFSPPPRTPPPWAPRPNRHGVLTDAARASATRLTHATSPGQPPTDDDHDPDF